MRATITVAVGWALLAMAGCASTGTMGGAMRGSFTAGAGAPSVRVSATRTVDTGVNPLVPVHISTDGNALEVTFGQRGHAKVTRLDPETLNRLAEQEGGRSEAAAAPPTGTARAVLRDGRFVVCWTETMPDGGRRAMAQMWGANGSSHGTPVPISQPDADVIGAPHVMTDGQHIIAAYMATNGNWFHLQAVSLEDAQRPPESGPTAQR